MFKTRLPELVGKLEAKEGKSISQGELGKRVGLSRQTINNWMSGTITLLDAKAAKRLSEYFEIDWRDLAELIEENTPKS